MRASDLRSRVGFFQLQSADDGYGNIEAGYPADSDFECWANIRPRLGGENVLADRLTGTNVVNITVRQSSCTRQVNTSWKVKDQRSATEYNIRSIIDPFEHTAQRGTWFEMLCEKGVAIASQQS